MSKIKVIEFECHYSMSVTLIVHLVIEEVNNNDNNDNIPHFITFCQVSVTNAYVVQRVVVAVANFTLLSSVTSSADPLIRDRSTHSSTHIPTPLRSVSGSGVERTEELRWCYESVFRQATSYLVYSDAQNDSW